LPTAVVFTAGSDLDSRYNDNSLDLARTFTSDEPNYEKELKAKRGHGRCKKRVQTGGGYPTALSYATDADVDS
jgi:hypothetical protein